MALASLDRRKATLIFTQQDCANRLLARASKEDFDALAPCLEHVKMPKGHVLVESEAEIDHLYFPLSGIISLVARSPEGHEVEAGIFGRDGFGPIQPVLGSDRSPYRCQVQIHDDCLRVNKQDLLDAVERSASFRLLLLRFAQIMNMQTAFTALSNAIHPIDERLARWLLMCHDRHDSDDIPLTHEFISLMLSVRRPSVTTSLHVLEGNKFIESDRGYIRITNRKALEEFAGDAYGKPEAEYRRLIGPL